MLLSFTYVIKISADHSVSYGLIISHGQLIVKRVRVNVTFSSNVAIKFTFLWFFA